MSHMSRQDLEAIMATRMAEDPGFRARLIEDPSGGLAEIAGFDLPDSVKVTVHEESLTDIHLVIPASSSPLSESDLELVSGGWNGESCYSCI